MARHLRTTKTTVAKWRSQFVARRLAGLSDEPRVGAPRTITGAAVEAIVVKTLETTPPGEIHTSMAKAAGIRHTMVGRIWRTFDCSRTAPSRAAHAGVRTFVSLPASFSAMPIGPFPVLRARIDEMDVIRSTVEAFDPAAITVSFWALVMHAAERYVLRSPC